MVPAVVSLADNDMQMIFTPLSCSLDALFEYIFGFLNEQAVQIDCIALNTTICVILAENVVTRLSIVLLHFGSVLFSLFRQFVSASAVARFVGLVRFVEARAALCSLLARKVAQTVVLGLGIVVGVVQG
jgi:hypothetical protein